MYGQIKIAKTLQGALIVLALCCLFSVPARAQICAGITPEASCLTLPPISISPEITRFEARIRPVPAGGSVSYCITIPPGVEWMTYSTEDIGCAPASHIVGVTKSPPTGDPDITSCTVGVPHRQPTSGPGIYEFTVEDRGGCALEIINFFVDLEISSPGPPPPFPGFPPPSLPPTLPPLSGSARGQPGCDSDYFSRLLRYNEAHILRELAIIEEMIEKPDSTQILTCLDQALGESAKSGKIFSDVPTAIITDLLSGVVTGLLGSSNILTAFIPGLGNVSLNTMQNTLGYIVVPAFSNFVQNFFGSLADLFSDFVGGILGSFFDTINVGGLLGGFFDWLLGDSATFECDAMSSLWDAVIVSGINPEYSYFSYNNFVRGDIPATLGDIYKENMFGRTGPRIRQDAMDSILTLKPDGSIPYYLQAPPFTGNEDVPGVIGQF